jgi:hypothetical protein
LNDLLAEAKLLEQGNLTLTAWNVLQDAIADAEILSNDLYATQNEVNAKITSLRFVITLFMSSGAASGLDKDNLADGTYSLHADMIKMSRRSNDFSMANNAIGHNVKLTVEGGQYFITVEFKGLAIEDKFGYLAKLFYYDPVVYDSIGYPIAPSTAKAATVLSYQTNPDGSYKVDTYNDASNPYPKLLKFSLVDKADYDGDFVPLQVFVPIMESIGMNAGVSGQGWQDVLMRLDWTTLKSATDADFVNDEVNAAPLSAKVAEAAAIAQGNKSAEAYAALQSVINAARAVLGRPDASQAEIDAALATLSAAIAAFNGSADNIVVDNTGDNNNAVNNVDLNKSPAGAVVTSLSTLTITAADKVWTGKKIASGFALTAGGKTLALGTDYTVASTGANKNIGAGTVQIVGTGGYTDTVTVKFRIVPKAVSVKSVKPGKGSLTVKWAKAPSAEKITKYEVRWKVKGTKSWKSKAVSSAKSSLAVKKLKKGKRYEVQARVYKTVGGVKYYSTWSKVKVGGKVK